jgi:hypothetical protein
LRQRARFNRRARSGRARTGSRCGPRLAVPRQREHDAVDPAEANRPASGRGPRNQNIDPSRGAKRYRLVAASATTAAIHDGEDHDGHQSSQRGSDPKGSAREWHSNPLPLANRNLNSVTTTLNPCYSGARKRCPSAQVLATCFTYARIARKAAPGRIRQARPSAAPPWLEKAVVAKIGPVEPVSVRRQRER